MALAWTSAIQNNVALLLMETPYASLTTDQKNLIDGSWTSGAPTGCAGDALSIVQQWAQWFNMAGVSAGPDAFAPWLVDETCLRAVRVLRPDRYPIFERSVQRTKADALRTFTSTVVDATAAPSSDAFLGHLQNVRKYVMNYLVRLDPPLFLPIDVIDQSFYSAVNKLWKRANWLFKRRSIQLSIAADGTVTNDLSGETMDGIASREFYYTDDTGVNTCLQWGSADLMAKQKVRWGTTTGRPQFFRIQKVGDTRTWRLTPTPDAAYTLYGEVYVDGPGTPASATATTVMDKFPVAFWPLIRMATLCEALESSGHRNSNEIYNKVEHDVTVLLTEWDDPGAPDNDQEIRDVNNDVSEIAGNNYLGGGL